MKGAVTARAGVRNGLSGPTSSPWTTLSTTSTANTRPPDTGLAADGSGADVKNENVPYVPSKVRRAHAAQLARRRARRREVGRHPHDRRAHAVLLEHVPERLAIAQQGHAPAS